MSVAGTGRYPPAEVTSLSALKADQPVTPSDLDNAVKQMSATGLFASLKYRYVTSGNHLDVTFDIEEPRWSMPVVFDNFVWLSDDELLAAVKRYMQQRSTMTPRLDDATHRLVLDVTIVEGAKFRLGELAMAGMSDEDADALRKKWTLKAGDSYDGRTSRNSGVRTARRRDG